MTRMLTWPLAMVLFAIQLASADMPQSTHSYPTTDAEPSDFLQELRTADVDAPRVDLRGDPTAIEFTGVTSFSVDAIRHALAGDMAYQSAARPSADLQTFLDVLQKRIEEGYGRAGIPARIKASLSTAPPRVVVTCEDSGQVFKFRGFNAAGEMVPPELLHRIRGKTEREWCYRTPKHGLIGTTNRDAWQKGEPWRCDEQSMAGGMMHVLFCFLDCGIQPGTDFFDLDRSEQKGEVELTIACDPDRPIEPIKLSPIEVKGLSRHTREEVLELIGIAEGDPLHYTKLNRACERLAESHCFWGHRIEVVLPDKRARYQTENRNARLVISVTESEKLPKLGEPLRDVDQALLRSGEWLGRVEQLAEDFQVSLQSEQFSASGVISPSEKAMLVEVEGKVPVFDGLTLTLDHTAVFAPTGLTIFDWRREEKISLGSSRTLKVNLSLQPTVEESGAPSAHFKLGLGVGSKREEAPWDLKINPIALLKLGWGQRTATIENGELTLSDEEVRARIDVSTGRWIEASAIDATGSGYRLATRHGEFASRVTAANERAKGFTQQRIPQDDMPSLLEFGIDQLITQTTPGEVVIDPSLVTMVKQTLRSPELTAWLESRRKEKKLPEDEADPSDEPARNFDIPASQAMKKHFDGQLTGELMQAVPALADLTFERGSWPWTLMRELALEEVCKVENDFAPLSNEMKRLSNSQETGPLFALLGTLRYESRRSAAIKFARLGLDRLDEQALRRDLSHFTEGDLFAAQAVDKLAVLATHVTAAQRNSLLTKSPELARPPLEAILERWRQHPDEPPREAVVVAVVEAWNNGWREQVEQRLRKVTGSLL